MTCNFCRKEGHLKRDCWKLKFKQSDDCKSKGTSSAEASYVEEDFDVGALVVTSEYRGGDSWILDSIKEFPFALQPRNDEDEL